MSQYGEPLHDGSGREIKTIGIIGGAVVYDRRGMPVAMNVSHDRRGRIIECVNACADLNPAGIPFLVSEVERVVAAMRANLGTYRDPTNILPTLETALRGVKHGP